MWMARLVLLERIISALKANQPTAVAFGYLERLLHIGDTNKFLEEETRLRSLSNVLNAAGFDAYLYEDFGTAQTQRSAIDSRVAIGAGSVIKRLENR